MSIRLGRLLAVLLGAAIFAWAADPVVGTWELNKAKSTYLPGPAPKNETRIYDEQPGGVRVTVRTIEADGSSTTVHISANYDGKDYPVTGDGEINAIALKKVNEYTAEATLMHGGNVVATAVRELSRDSKTMTITYKGTDREGRRVNNKAVYEKQ